ncbi:hypothetical protein BDR03DRAFT_1016588 [Suillus americanus]|nr:hypothetical protein BDR03DRAFT_1016588 [Suillus americanus]
MHIYDFVLMLDHVLASVYNHGSSVPARCSAAAAMILDHRLGFASTASEYQLNQHCSQNSALANASEVNRKVLALKAKARNSQVDIDCSLWVYPPQKKQNIAKQAEIPASQCNFLANESARDTFQQLLMKAKGMYASTISLSTMKLVPSDIIDLMFQLYVLIMFVQQHLLVFKSHKEIFDRTIHDLIINHSSLTSVEGFCDE